MRRAFGVAVVLATVLAIATPAAAHERETSGAPRVGVLIADHGEPPAYNADTYWSFREFFAHLIEMGVLPLWLTLLDTGTVLHDRSCPGCDEPRGHPRLVDAWLRPHDGPAAFVPASKSLPAHYVAAGGPGLGEPDIYEHVGLAARHEWQLMGGRSPNYDQKLAKKHATIRRLRARFGAGLTVRTGYGIDPRLGGGHQGLAEAVTGLINRDRVDTIVVAYHGVGFSDIMQTHMVRMQVADLVAELDPDVKLVFAEPMGVTKAYVDAVAEQAVRQLDGLPREASVAIHLSEHGLPTTTCGDYDCGADGYHDFAAALFARTRTAILRAADRPGRTAVFQVYGDGGAGDDDPDDLVDSPIEALEKRAAGRFDHVIDIPYAFDSDSRDTLIVLRRGYERPIPDWDERYVSHFAHESVQVHLTNAQFGDSAKVRAFTAVTAHAIRAALAGGGEPPAGHEH